MNYIMKAKVKKPDLPFGVRCERDITYVCRFCCKVTQESVEWSVTIEELGRYPVFVDLKDDESFDANEKEKWLESWARKYWDGKNGAWILDCVYFKTSRAKYTLN